MTQLKSLKLTHPNQFEVVNINNDQICHIIDHAQTLDPIVKVLIDQTIFADVQYNLEIQYEYHFTKTHPIQCLNEHQQIVPLSDVKEAIFSVI